MPLMLRSYDERLVARILLSTLSGPDLHRLQQNRGWTEVQILTSDITDMTDLSDELFVKNAPEKLPIP